MKIEAISATIYGRKLAVHIWGDSVLCEKRISDSLPNLDSKKSFRTPFDSAGELEDIATIKSKQSI